MRRTVPLYWQGSVAGRSVAAAPDRTTVGCVVTILAACLFLQRFAVPVGSAQISAAFLAGYMVFGLMLLLGRLTIVPSLLMLFLATTALMTVSFLISDTRSSVTSFAELVSIYALYVFKVRYPDKSVARILDIYQTMMAFCAIMGILQFFSQFVIGSVLAFPIDAVVPKKILYEGYNTIIPLTYGSAIMKSNGVFFLEPSFFSQFLGLALIIELARAQRLQYLALYAIAMIFSYSGTGLSLVLLFLPWILFKRGSTTLLALGVVAAVILVLAAGALHLSALTNRIDEFSQPESSGFARFVSPFWLIHDFLLDRPSALLFGMGAGSINQVMLMARSHDYLAHDPTWIKVVFEYGVVVAAFLMVYVGTAFLHGTRNRLLCVAALYIYLFLGGYLLNGIMHLAFVALAAWHRQTRPAQRRRAPWILRREVAFAAPRRHAEI